MKQAKITAVAGYEIGAVDDRLFGSFVEHMGSCVYNGIFQPGHPTADTDGFRGDVLALAKALRLSVLRYPGGNYVSGYRWRDTVGPVARRPTRLDLAWRTIEPNTFGLAEFAKWAEQVGSDIIMTLNLGTGNQQDACDLVEYMNFPGGTTLSDLRAAHGKREPYGIKTWCLGNEMDGPWQIGHKTSGEYARLAVEIARALRKIDPALSFVAVGSSHEMLDTYPEWNREVLMQLYDDVEYLSMHKYIGRPDNTQAEYLISPLDMEQQIRETIAICDHVKAVKRSKKTMWIAFDEYMPSNPDWKGEPEPWQTGAVRDMAIYSMEDTLVFGSMLLTLLRHCDRVKIACQAILVNVIPLIVAEKDCLAWGNAPYYAMLDVSLYGRGHVLQTKAASPLMQAGRFGEAPVLDHICVHFPETGEMTLFVINRGEEELTLSLETFGFAKSKETISHAALYGALQDKNDRSHPSRLTPREMAVTPDPIWTLPAYSWNTIRLREQH